MLPQARGFHSCVCVIRGGGGGSVSGGGVDGDGPAKDHNLIIFGGRSSTNADLNDMHIFCTHSMTWINVPLPTGSGSDQWPDVRGAHSMNVLDAIPGSRDQQLVLFGGSTGLNDLTNEWDRQFGDVWLLDTSDLQAAVSKCEVAQKEAERPVKKAKFSFDALSKAKGII